MPNNNANKIGVSTATIIGINAMIGAGIFTAPALLATAKIGPAAILTYMFVVISVWFIAQSLARVASKFPEEGSFYTYTKQWGGHILGIIASASYLIGILMAMGVLTAIAGRYLQYFFPGIQANVLGLIALGIIIFINLLGVALAQLGQRILVFFTLFPILTTTVMCLTRFNLSLFKPFMPYGVGSIFKASRLVIFGFFGFESAASLFNIVKNPKKNVPKALSYSILAVGALYILFVGSIIGSTPISLFTSPTMPVPQVLSHIFPGHQWLITLLYISILSAIIGTIHSVIWSTSHFLVTLVKKLKSSTAKNMIASGVITQKISVLICGLFILVSFLTIKNLDLFFYFAALFIVFSYLTSIITLLKFKEEWKSRQNIKTLLGIATGFVILFFAFEGIIKELF